MKNTIIKKWADELLTMSRAEAKQALNGLSKSTVERLLTTMFKTYQAQKISH